MPQSSANVNPGDTQFRRPLAFSPHTAKARVLGRLIAGFAVILVLLGLDALVGFFGASSVRSNLLLLNHQQKLSFGLIDHLQRTQNVVNSIQNRLVAARQTPEQTELKKKLAGAEQTFAGLFARVSPDDPDFQTWRGLQTASLALTRDVGRALNQSSTRNLNPESILKEHEAVAFATQQLMRSIHDRGDAARRQIEEATWRQSIEDRVMLAACLLVSSLFLITGTRMYYRMSEQAEELNRVSWQLLERQELLAQRLSRELHDELGQSLTALKTNFSRHAAAGCVDPSWMHDCTDLLKGSIRSAHEISQLLRPTLLDDFGLDSALSWLCERFEERNRIQVRYTSDFHWRLDEQAETHIFRIAQEALTNVARHAKATEVQVGFFKQSGIVRLTIKDNGVGLEPRRGNSTLSFGLTGMKARARSLEGEMRIDSSPGQGVAIEVLFPAKHAP